MNVRKEENCSNLEGEGMSPEGVGGDQDNDQVPEMLWVSDVGDDWDFEPSMESDPESLTVKALLSQSRAFVARVHPPECSLPTAREYLRIYERVSENGLCLKELRSRSTYYKYRSALQNVARKRLSDALDAHEAGTFHERDLKCCWHTAKLLMQAGIWQKTSGCPIEDPVPKKSKRRSLKKRKWRERMWSECREDTKYRSALALLHVTGVRPKEVGNGIIVTAHEDELVMRIYVRGVKNSKDGSAGQPWRWLTYDCREIEYGTPEHYLQKQAFLNDGRVEIKAHAKRLNDFVRRLGDKVFGKKKHLISPYSYRHQFSANLKGESGLPGSAKVAMAMGHQSDRTQKQYGSVRQSSGGTGIVEVKAAKKVRQHRGARQFPREQATERMSGN